MVDKQIDKKIRDEQKFVNKIVDDLIKKDAATENDLGLRSVQVPALSDFLCQLSCSETFSNAKILV